MRIGLVPKINNEICRTLIWHTQTGTHRHNDWEIAIHYKGKSGHFVNGLDYPAAPNTFVLLGPHHLHRLYCEDEKKLLRRDIIISVYNMKKYCNEIHPGLYETLRQNNKPILFNLTESAQKNIQERLQRIDNYQIYNEGLAKTLLHAIIIELLSLYWETQYLKKQPQPPAWFLLFASKLQTPEYFSKKVEDLVAETHYNHAYFLKLFKRETGQTLISYITDLRMNHASHLLLTSDMTIIQIANTVGYTNHSFFSQKFRKYFLTTPEQYRSEHRE